MKGILDSPKLGAFIISFIVCVMFCVLLGYAMVRGLQDNAPLNQLTGSLIAAFSTVIAYWIGSSSSSKDKDSVIAQQANTTAAAVAQTSPVPLPHDSGSVPSPAPAHI